VLKSDLEKVIGELSSKIEQIGEKVGKLDERVEGLEKTVRKVEVFSDEEAAQISSAFGDVMKSLGVAITELSGKGIGVDVVFDSKKGSLAVSLFKYEAVKEGG
jgi:uncharacterized protein YlxW (UPF0749 family)